MNKKAQVITGGIVLIGIVVIGLLFFFLFPKDARGLTEEQVQDIIDGIIEEGDIVKLPDETRDADPDTTLPESTPTNTQPTAPETCVVSGHWQTVYVKKRTSIDESAKDVFGTNPRPKAYAVYVYTGNCVSDIYIEAGINPTTKRALTVALPFQFQRSTPSLCDANSNYYGFLYKNVDPGDRLQAVQLSPETPLAEGTYSLSVGAYTGCLNPDQDPLNPSIKKGGTTITENIYNIKISDSFSESIGGSASTSWEKVIG